MKKYFLSIADTELLKAIGIVLMVVGHTFTPGWYIDSISYSAIDKYFVYVRNFMEFAVVPLFAFITGYAYALKSDFSWKYALKKIIVFLSNYYIILIVLSILAAVFCGWNPLSIDTLKELYPIRQSLMIFAWYVPFYVEAMLLLPLLNKVVNNYGNKKALLFFIIGYLVLECTIGLLKSVGMRNLFWVVAAQDFKRTIPFVVMGYLFFKEHLFKKSLCVLSKYKLNTKYVFIIILVGIICLSCVNDKIIGLKSGIIYTPVYIFCIVMLRCADTSNSFLLSLRGLLATHSSNIWFLHSLFFSEVSRNVFQPIAFYPQNLILVVCWIVSLCLICSIVIKPVQDKVAEKMLDIFKLR